MKPNLNTLIVFVVVLILAISNAASALPNGF